MNNKHGQSDDNVYRQTLSRVSDAVILVDASLQYTYINQNAESLLEKSKSELLGKTIWDAFPNSANIIDQDKIEKTLDDEERISYEQYNKSVDKWFEVRVFPDQNGLSIFFTDITEQKECEEKVEQYKQILETLPIAVGQNTSGSEGTFEYVNNRMVEMLGLESEQETKQYSPADLYATPGDRKLFDEKLQANRRVQDFEIELEKPDGEQFWGSAKASIDTIDGNEYFTQVVQDITEQKKYTKKLQHLHDATQEMVSATTANHVADIVTRTADESIGYELNGVHFYDESAGGLVPASVSEASDELIGDVPVLTEGIAWTAFQTGEMQIYNNLADTDDIFNEETVFQSELAIPIGNHGALLASSTEVDAFRGDDLTLIKTLSRNAEAVLNQLQTEEKIRSKKEELNRQQQFLKQTQEVADVGGWEVDTQADTLKWTDEVHRIHGVSLDYEPTIEDAIQFYHPDDQDAIRNAFEDLMTAGTPFDLKLRIVRNNDELRWVRVRGEPWSQGNNILGARGTFKDITEHKKRKEELSKQDELLSTLFEYAPVHLFVKDRKCRHLWMSSAFIDNPDQYIGRHELEVTDSGSREFCIETLREDRQVINSGQSITEIEEYNDELGRWMLTSKVPWYDENGCIAGLVGYSVDITERKEYQQQIEQQNDRLDEFAGLISHDLRNPLTVALGRTAVLQQRCDRETVEQLDVIANSLERMEHIIEDTLTLARKGDAVGKFESVSLVELAGKCWQGVDTAEATLEIDDDIWIKGDADRLKHVFENLFSNAIEHGNDDVTIRINRLGETGFYIEDTGPGVAESNYEKIFQAGYSSEHDGTGLGLSIVKRIVEAHGWEISVTSGSDGGARFEFRDVEFADIHS